MAKAEEKKGTVEVEFADGESETFGGVTGYECDDGLFVITHADGDGDTRTVFIPYDSARSVAVTGLDLD